MLKSILHCLTFIIAIASSYGQSDNEVIEDVLINSLSTNHGKNFTSTDLYNYGATAYDLRNHEIEGSPFLNDRKYDLELILDSGKVLELAGYVNIQDHSLITQLEDGYYKMENLLIDTFYAYDKSLAGLVVMKMIPALNGRDIKYIHLLCEGENISLGKIYKSVFVPNNYNKALDVGQVNDRYEQKSELVVVNNEDRQFVSLKKKKDFKNFFNGKLYAFIKESNVDLKSEESLIDLIKNY